MVECDLQSPQSSNRNLRKISQEALLIGLYSNRKILNPIYLFDIMNQNKFIPIAIRLANKKMITKSVFALQSFFFTFFDSKFLKLHIFRLFLFEAEEWIRIILKLLTLLFFTNSKNIQIGTMECIS